jgi:hypothetical protein
VKWKYSFRSNLSDTTISSGLQHLSCNRPYSSALVGDLVRGDLTSAFITFKAGMAEPVRISAPPCARTPYDHRH